MTARGAKTGATTVRALVFGGCLVAAMAAIAVSAGDARAGVASSGADRLIGTGQLLASDAPIPGEILFTSIAMSGGTVIAGASRADVNGNQFQGAAYVFTRPAMGWSDETDAAKLVASDGYANEGFGAAVAISGKTVAVSGDGPLSSGVYVFTKPDAGWSGTLHEAARLTVAGSGDTVSSLAMSGGTIVVSTRGYDGLGGPVYVFTEPASGWSGSIPPSATLTAPDTSGSCSRPAAVAIDRSTIAAAGSGCNPQYAYVWTKPASGWSGTIHPRAALIVKSGFVSSVAVVGSSIVVGEVAGVSAGPLVFNRPRTGWAGTVRPAASLKVENVSADAFYEFIAGSGNELAVLVDASCGTFICGATLYAFSKPPNGWRGEIAASNRTSDPGDAYLLAMAGPTIAAGSQGAIEMFTIPPGAPSAENVSLSGLRSGRPRLRLTLTAGQNAAPIRSFQLSLPRGLRFAPRGGRDVHLTAPADTRLGTATLTVTLPHPTDRISVTLDPPAITEEHKLLAQIVRLRTYNRTHKRFRTLTLHIQCVITDAARHELTVSIKTK